MRRTLTILRRLTIAVSRELAEAISDTPGNVQQQHLTAQVDALNRRLESIEATNVEVRIKDAFKVWDFSRESYALRADLEPRFADLLRRVEAVELHAVNGTLARNALLHLLNGATDTATRAEAAGTDVSSWYANIPISVARAALKTLSEG